ncbi:MAG: hypothetical protein ACLP0J_16855 [Solirubrobacteraceae bacterium]
MPAKIAWARLAAWVVVSLVVFLAPAGASASGTYDLTGTWDTYAPTGGGYTGTFAITSMDLATGRFSGTGDSGAFVLVGTESGSAVEFTQSSGGYVATDDATVQTSASGLEMVNGTWSDTNRSSGTFLASLTSAPRTSTATVSCADGATASAPLNCTATVTDTSGMAPAEAPDGTVSLSSNDGALAGPACTLAASGASAASCTFAYSAPTNVGNGSPDPVITATYGGDAQFAQSQVALTIDCTSGLIFQLDSATSSSPSAHGYRVDGPVTLHGCGLTSQTKARFGDDDATATPAAANDVAADGTSITLTVPAYAITGPLTVSDPTRLAAGTLTLTSPNPLPIDSWRNTNGFSFANYAGTLTAQDLLLEFPTSDLTVAAGGATPVLRPWADTFLGLKQRSVLAGVCFGLGLISGEIADGKLSASALGLGADTAFDLTKTSLVDDFATQEWLAQDSDQAQPFRTAAKSNTDQADVLSQLQAAMGGPDGFTQPAMIGIHFFDQRTGKWEGHAEVAYGYSLDDQGVLTIYTADSNVPFTSAEYGDSTDAAHKAALTDSWIKMGSLGKWSAPHEDMHGTAQNLDVYPVSALQGPVTLSRSQPAATTSVTLGGADQVESVQNASGEPLDLTEQTPQMTIAPVMTSFDSETPRTGPGVGGIDQLLISGETSTTTLNGGTSPIQALWQTADIDASLDAGSGHLAARFDPGHGTITLTSAPHERAPGSASVTVTDKLDKDATEHVLTVTGPSHFTAGLASDGGEAAISSATGGSYAVTLAIVGAGQGAQSADLGTVPIPAGGTLAITPKSWAHLSASRYRAVVYGHGKTIRLELSNRLRAPAAVLERASISGPTLRLWVHVPNLTPGQSSVTLTAKIRLAGKLVTQVGNAPAGGSGRTETVSLKLAGIVSAGSRLSVTVRTVNGATTPTEATSTFSASLR